MTAASAEEIAEHTKGNDDRETIIIKELKSHLKGLSYKKEDKGKKKWTFQKEEDRSPFRERET